MRKWREKIVRENIKKKVTKVEIERSEGKKRESAVKRSII